MQFEPKSYRPRSFDYILFQLIFGYSRVRRMGRQKRQYLLPLLVSIRDLEKSDPVYLLSVFTIVGIVKFNWQMISARIIVGHYRMQEQHQDNNNNRRLTRCREHSVLPEYWLARPTHMSQ